jgi:hypothetical protein
MEQRRPGLPANFRVEQQRRSDLPAWLASSGAAAAAGLACSRTECLQQAPPPVLAYRAAARPVLTRLLVGWLGGGGAEATLGGCEAPPPARPIARAAWPGRPRAYLSRSRGGGGMACSRSPVAASE